MWAVSGEVKEGKRKRKGERQCEKGEGMERKRTGETDRKEMGKGIKPILG